MKKYTTLLYGILFSIKTYGQITNISITNRLKLDRVHLGLHGKSSIKMTDFNKSNIVSLQTGLMLIYSLNKVLKIRSQGALKLENNKEIKGFSSYELIYNPLKKN